jgi:hypothetical protein
VQIKIVGQSYTQTIKVYLLTNLNYKYSFAGQVVAILLGFTVFFAGLAIGAPPDAHHGHTKPSSCLSPLPTHARPSGHWLPP